MRMRGYRSWRFRSLYLRDIEHRLLSSPIQHMLNSPSECHMPLLSAPEDFKQTQKTYDRLPEVYFMPRSRRTLLTTAALALGSGTLASIAGCLGDPSVGNERPPDDTSTTTQSTRPTAPEFARWLPDPTTTPLRDGYEILYFDLNGIRSHRAAIHENAYDRLETQMLRPIPSEHVDVSAVEAVLSFGDVQLVFGSFDPEAFGEKLTGNSQSDTATTTSSSATATQRSETMQSTTTTSYWAKQGRYKGFDLYGTEYVYAVSEDALLEVSPWRGADPMEHSKAVIDASTGETSHYADHNEYVSSMLGVVDAPDALWCYPEAMDGSTSRGFRKDVITGELTSWRFGTETTHLTWANTYLDTETAESGELRDYIDSESERFGPYDGLDVEIAGRLAWTHGSIPTREFDHLSPGGPGDGVTTSHQSSRRPF